MHSHPFRTWPLTFVLIALAVLCASVPGQAAPRLAQARSAAASPRTIAVPAGADLQMAVDRAAPGDVLALAPGATYIGPITLPKKAGDAWIVIKTAARRGRVSRRGPPREPRRRPADAEDRDGRRTRDPRGARRAPLPVRRDRDRAEGRRLRDQPRRAQQSGDLGRGPAAPHRVRALLSPWRQGEGLAPGHRAQCAGCRDRRLALLRLQGGRRGIPGDRRLERAGPLQHRQQLPGGGGRERDVRRRRSVHPGPRAVGHRDPPESHRQAARLEGRRAGLRGQGLGGEEPARAQERAPRGHRGQSPRGQLAPGAERVRRALHGAEPGRRGAVVDRRGRHVRQQHRPAHRRRGSISSGGTTCGRARSRGASRSGTTCSRTSAARAGAAAARSFRS